MISTKKKLEQQSFLTILFSHNENDIYFNSTILFLTRFHTSITVEENGVAHFGGNSMLGYLQQEIPLDKRIPALMPYRRATKKKR